METNKKILGKINTQRCSVTLTQDQRRIFIFSFGGVDKYLGEVLLLALAGARKGQGKSLTKFVLGLHGKIWDHNIGNFTNLVVRIIKYETIKSKYI